MRNPIVCLLLMLCTSGCLEDFVIIPPPEPNGLQVIGYETDGGVIVCPATKIGPRLVTVESSCVRETMSVRTSATDVIQVVGYTMTADSPTTTLLLGEDL